MVTIVKKSDMRLLTKTLAVVSLLAPASGYTLGIGEIRLHSALNQNLDAEISLTLSGESVSDIKVNLAPPEKFDEAGVSWTYFLSKIKFETITQSNSSAVIKLTSKEALKEPFLDFLLEVSWPKGNLYREFTVLVDPPSVYNQATIPVSTSTGSYTQRPTAKSHANGQSTEGEYGPTLQHDTLWSVAERTRGQSGISVEQMMIALYEANPQAFYKGNVFALTAGKMLKIPERDAVLKLSRNQALAEFNRHKKAWKNQAAPANVETAKKKPVPSKDERSVSSKAEGAVDNQLTLLAPTKAVVAGRTVVASANDQPITEKKAADVPSKTVKGKPAPSAAEGADGDTSDTLSIEDGTAQSKIAALEKQLAMMQMLLALKSQQLADLQNQSQTNSVVQKQTIPDQAEVAKPANQTTPAPQQSVQPAPSEVVTAKQADHATPIPSAPQQTVVLPISNEIATAKQVDQATPVTPVAPQQAIVQPTPSEVVTAKSVDQTTLAAKKTVVQPVQPEPEAGSLFDPYYLGLGGAGAVILGMLGWLWWRKRKVDEETNTESMFASTSIVKAPEVNENIAVPVVEDADVHDAGTVGESSFLSEFTPSDFDSFDTDQGEIDPISEADVYLAYGRYQQAEELIRQAIKDQPNRDECKLKLLEIFYANENKAAFEAYANELAEAGKRNESEFWEQAAEMGREICPNSPLFSSGDDLFAVEDNTAVENVVGDVGIKEKEGGAGAASFDAPVSVDLVKKITEQEDSKPGIDLATSEAKDDSVVDELRNNEDIDFDLSSFSIGAKELDEAENHVVTPSIQTDVSSGAQVEAFDLNSFSMEAKESDEAEKDGLAFSVQTTASPEVLVEDIDLSSFSIGTQELGEAESDVIVSSAQTGASPGADIEAFDFDLDSFSMDVKKADEVEKGGIASSTQAGAPSGMLVEEIDFDLSSFSADSNESNVADNDFTVPGTLSEADAADRKQEFESYEFGFTSDNVDSKGVDDLDFSALENDNKNHQDVDFSADRLLDFNEDLGGDFDFNFDLDMPLATRGRDANQQDEFGVSDLTDMDELETKLDLAKAYVDMGDAEAAKDLAREVLEQGTAEQKKIAQTLLDELG